MHIDVDKDNATIVKLLLFNTTINDDEYFIYFLHCYIICEIYMENLPNKPY